MKQTKLLSALAALTASLSLLLVGLGGYVRGTGAGLSCPDWPLCYGRAIPADFGNGVLQEVGHRYLASAISLLMILFLVLSYLRKADFPEVWNAAKFAVVILVLQVILGGLTVLMKLNPFIVTAHLALGTLFFQTFALVAASLRSGRSATPSEISGVSRKELGLLIFLTFLQMLIGGFVGSSGASLACPDLPLCFGSLLPDDATHQQQIHVLHRGLAIVIFLAISLAALKEYSLGRRETRNWFASAWFFTLIQLILGVMNVLLRIPVHVAVSHLLVAQLILFSLLQVWRKKAESAAFVQRELLHPGGVRFRQSAVRES